MRCVMVRFYKLCHVTEIWSTKKLVLALLLMAHPKVWQSLHIEKVFGFFLSWKLCRKYAFKMKTTVLVRNKECVRYCRVLWFSSIYVFVFWLKPLCSTKSSKKSRTTPRSDSYRKLHSDCIYVKQIKRVQNESKCLIILSFRPDVSHVNQAIYDNTAILSTMLCLSLQMPISLYDLSSKKKKRRKKK